MFKKRLINHRKQKNEDIRELKEIFEEIKKTEVSLETIHILINMSINDLKFCTDIFQFSKEKYTPKNLDENIYTPYMKSLCKNNLLEQAYQILLEMIDTGIHPHFRTLIPFFAKNFPAFDSEKSFRFFAKLYYLIFDDLRIIPNQELLKHMFQFISKSPFAKIFWFDMLKKVFKYFGCVDTELAQAISESVFIESFEKSQVFKLNKSSVCNNCGLKLNLFDITDSERKLFLEIVANKIKNISQFKSFLDRKNHDIVLDGANIAMFNNSPFNLQKIEKVIKYFTHNSKKVLVILHISRKRKEHERLYKLKNVDFFYSPKQENDDLFWLYAAIYQNAMVVTNDQMSDHVFKIFSDSCKKRDRFGKIIQQEKLFSYFKWNHTHIINYSFNNDSSFVTDEFMKNKIVADRFLKLWIPKEYSYRIQLQSLQSMSSNNSDCVCEIFYDSTFQTKSGYIHIPVSKDRWLCCKLC